MSAWSPIGWKLKTLTSFFFFSFWEKRTLRYHCIKLTSKKCWTIKLLTRFLSTLETLNLVSLRHGLSCHDVKIDPWKETQISHCSCLFKGWFPPLIGTFFLSTSFVFEGQSLLFPISLIYWIIVTGGATWEIVI